MQLALLFLLFISCLLCLNLCSSADLPSNAYLPPIVAASTATATSSEQEHQQLTEQPEFELQHQLQQLQHLWLPLQHEYALDLPLQHY